MDYKERTTDSVWQLLYGPVFDTRAQLRAIRAKERNRAYDPFDLKRPVKQVVIIIKKDKDGYMTKSPQILEYDLFLGAFEIINRE